MSENGDFRTCYAGSGALKPALHRLSVDGETPGAGGLAHVRIIGDHVWSRALPRRYNAQGKVQNRRDQCALDSYKRIERFCEEVLHDRLPALLP